MATKISIDISDSLFFKITSELEFLGYESVEDLVRDSVQLRVESLLQLIALSQSSHGPPIR